MHTYMKNTMPTREEVLHFLSTEQQLLGCGYGDGSGDGSDYEEVHGSGSFGSGGGSGLSTGYGCGDIDISYNCYNKDIKAFNDYIVDYVNNIPTIITQIHYNIAYGCIINKDLTLEPHFIAKVGCSFGLRKTIKDAIDDAKNNETERLKEYLYSELRNIER